MRSMSTPIRRTPPYCCARAVSGHAAAPPSPTMNSRRRIGYASEPLCRQHSTETTSAASGLRGRNSFDISFAAREAGTRDEKGAVAEIRFSTRRGDRYWITSSPSPDRSRRWSMKPLSYASDHPSGIRPNDTDLIAVADHDSLLLKVLAEVILGR
jgi:hypothetical protein